MLPEENPEKRALLDAWHIIRQAQQIVHAPDAWHQLESTLYYLDQRLRGYFSFESEDSEVYSG